MPHRILLTGFMGSGKSTVGPLLGAHLGYTFIDTDAEIVRQSGHTIPALFAQGEVVFRAWETTIAHQLVTQTNVVVATGGGFLLNPEHVALLTESHFFYLTATPAELLRRLSQDLTPRPLLNSDDPLARITHLLEQRQAAYARFTPIPTDRLTPTEIVAAICTHLE